MKYSAPLFFISLLLLTGNCHASILGSDNINYLEIGVAKSRALDTDVYVPNATIGGLRYRKRIPFQITLGFLNRDVSRTKDGKQQDLKDFFYIGPQYIGRYRLASGLYTELGLAILTGNHDFQSSQVNTSSYRGGIFFGIQPKIKFSFKLYKKLSLVFESHYILVSSDLDEGASDIGPSLGLGLRYHTDF